MKNKIILYGLAMLVSVSFSFIGSAHSTPLNLYSDTLTWASPNNSTIFSSTADWQKTNTYLSWEDYSGG